MPDAAKNVGRIQAGKRFQPFALDRRSRSAISKATMCSVCTSDRNSLRLLCSMSGSQTYARGRHQLKCSVGLARPGCRCPARTSIVHSDNEGNHRRWFRAGTASQTEYPECLNLFGVRAPADHTTQEHETVTTSCRVGVAISDIRGNG